MAHYYFGAVVNTMGAGGLSDAGRAHQDACGVTGPKQPTREEVLPLHEAAYGNWT